MKKAIINSATILALLSILGACSSTNRLTIKNQSKMFTEKQIKEKFTQVRTGADFPALAKSLKNMGVTYYETKLEDGSTVYHGEGGYELFVGPNYGSIRVTDKVDAVQLKADITKHQQGKSDYFEISQQCADNGIEKWAVCLTAMTCSYIDRAGNKVLVEHIPDVSTP